MPRPRERPKACQGFCPSFLNTLVLKPASGAAGVCLAGRLPRVLRDAALESALATLPSLLFPPSVHQFLAQILFLNTSFSR